MVFLQAILAMFETYIFLKIIHNRGIDIDCIKTIEAVQIAFNCREFKFTRANELTHMMTRQCSPSKSIQVVLNSLEPYVQSSSWLTHFWEANEINIKNPVTFEATRRKYFNVGAITNFFQLHSGLLNPIDPSLIWNADETSSESSRKYKVLLTNYIQNSICPDSKYSNRITTVLSVNALSQKFDLFVYVPDSKTYLLNYMNLNFQ